MFNRHTYERYERVLEQEQKKEHRISKVIARHREQQDEKVEQYKARVRDFLVQVASKPIKLGQYIPPVKNIMRENKESKNLANAQLYINGFKTNKERLDRAVSLNKIIDYTPTPDNALNYKFRPRDFEKEIQPGMRFMGSSSPKNSSEHSREGSKMTVSRSAPKHLPAISNQSMPNPEGKMHFKGVEEMGNKLKSMEQKESDRIGLINKLQTVYGGGEIDLEKTSLEVLTSCKLNKNKSLKSLKSVTLKSLQTERSQE